jgi:hypothetical protein
VGEAAMPGNSPWGQGSYGTHPNTASPWGQGSYKIPTLYRRSPLRGRSSDAGQFALGTGLLRNAPQHRFALGTGLLQDPDPVP